MSQVFVDTSAFYAVLVRTDPNHPAAVGCFRDLVAQGRPLATTSFVVHETLALLQSRLGLPAVRDWEERLEPLLEIVWVEEALYREGLRWLLAARRPGVSLTDWTSFVCMEQRGWQQAFAFDEDFARQGFATIPKG